MRLLVQLWTGDLDIEANAAIVDIDYVREAVLKAKEAFDHASDVTDIASLRVWYAMPDLILTETFLEDTFVETDDRPYDIANIRTDADQLVVTKSGFYWSAYLRHGNGSSFETQTLSWDLLA